MASLPYQLTWKGVQIFFPNVVLTQDLKDIADEALRKRLKRESSSFKEDVQEDSDDEKDSQREEINQSVPNSPVPSHTSSSTTEKKFKCGACDKVCSNSFNLKSHVLTHSKYYDVPVNIDGRFGPCQCGNLYQSRSGFRRHRVKCAVVLNAASNTNANKGKCKPPKTTSPSPSLVSAAEDDNSNSTVLLRHDSPDFETEEIKTEKSETEYMEDSEPGFDNTHQEGEKAAPNTDEIDSFHENNDNTTESDELYDDFAPILTNVVSTAANILSCFRCDTQFPNMTDYKRHAGICEKMTREVDDAGRPRKYHCKFCPWKFAMSRTLNNHELIHTGALPYQCKLCKRRFRREDYLQKHTCDKNSEHANAPLASTSTNTTSTIEKTISDQNFEPIKCPSCPRTFAAEKYLKSHFKIHQRDIDPDAEASHETLLPILKSESESSLSLSLDQLPTIPSVSKECKCSDCGRTFKARMYLNFHMKSCKGKKSKSVKGEPKMSKAFGNEDNKTTFVTTTTSQQQPQLCNSSSNSTTCDICHRTYVTVGGLKSHKKVCTKALPLGDGVICPYCENKYTDYKKHIRLHKCFNCGKDFTSFFERDEHRVGCTVTNISRTSDMWLKFKCKDCDERFEVRDLILHAKTHMKEPIDSAAVETVVPNNMKCDLCGKIFSDNIELSKHCLSHVLRNDATMTTSLGSIQTNPLQTSSNTPDQPSLADLPFVVASTTMFTCKFKTCSHFFSHDEDLWYHIDKKHKSVGNICCGQCGKDFESADLVSSHENKVHEPKLPSKELPTALESDIPSEPIEINATSSVSFNLKRDSVEPLPLMVKTELSEGVDDDYSSHFDDADDQHFPNVDIFVPETSLMETSEISVPDDSEVRRNPFVVISSECKAVADARLLEMEEDENPKLTIDDVPLEDYYTCLKCYDLKTFYCREEYVDHINNDHDEDTNKKKRTPRPSRLREDIPLQEVYYCKTCNNRAYTSRILYINHVNYHQKMQLRGIDRPVEDRTKSNRRRRVNYNVPFQDVYQCDHCEDKRIFDTRQKYLSHLYYHKVYRQKMVVGKSKRRRAKGEGSFQNMPFQDKYTCETCEDREFFNRSSYIVHLRYHAKLKSMGADRRIMTREEVAKLKIKRESNISEIADQETYTCEICNDGRTFSHKMSYHSHLVYHDRLKRMGENRRIKRKGEVNPDSLSQSIPFQDIYKCDICTDRTFTDRGKYISHVVYHKGVREKEGTDRPCKRTGAPFRQDIPLQDVYTCTECDGGKMFTERRSYIIHLNYHKSRQRDAHPTHSEVEAFASNPEDDMYKCKSCAENGIIKTFSDRFKYSSHLKYHKMQKKSYQTLMSSGLLHSNNNSSHLNLILPDTSEDTMNNMDGPVLLGKESFYCNICKEDKYFANLTGFRNHLEKHAAMKDKLYQCKVCQKTFSTMWNLSLHEKTHTGEKNYTCEDCGKRFRIKCVLLKHQATTCKKVPCKYSCFCGDKFHAITFLETHVARYHKDEEPSGGSTKKIQPQPTSKLIRCYVCDEQFTQAFDLNNHVRLNHPVDYEEFMQQKSKETQPIIKSENDFDKNEEDPEPVYPEIVMEDAEEAEPVVEDSHTDEYPIPRSTECVQGPPDENSKVAHSMEESQSSQEQTGTITWNFIPGLADNAVSEDDEDSSQTAEYYSEFLPESFEPEDVEVQGNPIQPELITIQDTEPVRASGATRDTFSSTYHKLTQRLNMKTKDQNQKERCKEPLSKPKRVFLDDGLYKCGYCTKTSHRVGYVKSHIKRIHPSLPVAYQTLEKNGKVISSTSNTVQTTTSDVQVARRRAESRKSSSEIEEIPIVKSSSSTKASTITTRRTSSTGTPGGTLTVGKSQSICDCMMEDSAFGFLKRCVGESCKCYSRAKGCSATCSCALNCNNPYFRTKQIPNLITIASTQAAPSAVQAPPSSTLQIQKVPTSTSGFANINVAYQAYPVINTSIQNNLNITYNQTNSNTNVNYVQEASNAQSQFFNPNSSNNDSTLRAYLAESPESTTTTNSSNYGNPVIQVQGTLNTANHNTPVSAISQYQQIRPRPDTSSPSQPLTTYPNLTIQNLAPVPQIQNHSNVNMIPPYQPQPNPSNSKVYRCFCNNDFHSLNSFLSHQWVHRNEELFLCPICRQQFSSVSQLMLHARLHPEENVTLLPCMVCHMPFNDSAELDNHFRTIHYSLVCQVCQKFCKNDYELRNHRHTQPSCPFCAEMFVNQGALKWHMDNRHGPMYINN